mgnify:FL=1|tara:strand:- start:209 stop:412 length:204 start_codon:yes stop_codon:yes gene_type:complete
MKIHTEIVNGVCPECEEFTMLVGVTRSFYRCMTCGADLEQHINGKISYVPVIPNIEKLKGLLDGEKV